ncbi:SMODS domain-containing nucleotidyltransferase [Paraburkholderia atlantica]|uniref:SMODS domain-containing nucleotidyltransferase n=1 Tax=Paraburkholderia atlantica TaxID=2654982 RepID=UPI0015916348
MFIACKSATYSRHMAIHGVSDLDMLFELPWELYERYHQWEGNGPSQLLQAVRDSIKTRYVNTEIKGDGQVVIQFRKFKVSGCFPKSRVMAPATPIPSVATQPRNASPTLGTSGPRKS